MLLDVWLVLFLVQLGMSLVLQLSVCMHPDLEAPVGLRITMFIVYLLFSAAFPIIYGLAMLIHRKECSSLSDMVSTFNVAVRNGRDL